MVLKRTSSILPRSYPVLICLLILGGLSLTDVFCPKAKAANNIFSASDANAVISSASAGNRALESALRTILTDGISVNGTLWSDTYVGGYGANGTDRYIPGQGYGSTCWAYANGFVYHMFGFSVSSSGAPLNSNGQKITALTGVTKDTVSYNTFVNAGVPNRAGTLIRSCTSNYMNSDDGEGHSIVLLCYDTSGVYYIDGNGAGDSQVVVRYKTWAELKTSNVFVRYSWNGNAWVNIGSRQIKYAVAATDECIKARYADNRANILSGVYVIHSAWDDNICLDIAGDSTENNANIQLYHRVNNNVQKFRIIKWDNNYYCIKSIYNGRWLDAASPIGDNSNVKLFDSNEYDEDYWYFEDAGDGYVYIRNKTGYYLDVQGDQGVDHANIQLYHYVGNKSQKWRLEDVTDYSSLEDGIYTVHTAIDTDYLLDIAGDSMENRANIQLYKQTSSDVQLFRFEKSGSNYVVQSVYSGKWLDIRTPIANNSTVQLWGDYSAPEEHWYLEDAGNGYFYMRSGADYYLDVQGDEAKNNANVQVYRFTGTNSQKWRISRAKPVVKVTAGSSLKETVIEWDAVSGAKSYGIHIIDSEGEYAHVRWGYGKTAFSALLPEGEYKARVTAVREGTNMEGDFVPFTVQHADAYDIGQYYSQSVWNNTLYNLYPKECSWLEAKALCEKSGGHLLTITSQEEQDIATSMVSNYGHPVFIGAEGYSSYDWKWITKESFTYQNWAEGQPDNWHGTENCGNLYTNGTWNDVSCSYEDIHGFIAEYEPVSVTVQLKTDVYGLDSVITKEDLEVNAAFADGTVMEVDDYILSVSSTDAGEQTITVKYGGLTASTTVTVSGSRIVLSDNEVTVIQKGSRFDLSATLYTTVTPAPSLRWSCIHSGDTRWDSSMYFQLKSDNPNVVTIGPDVRTGDYIVTCETSDGKASASCIVTVLPVPVTGISLSKTSMSMHVSDQATLSASVLPSYTTDNGVIWSSDKDSVASVVSGKVYANGAGTATITCTSESNPAIKATCTVTVSVPVSAVRLDSSIYEFGSSSEGSKELHATIVPEEATNKAVTWSSSNPAAATVAEGSIKPVAPGYTRITCASVDGPVGICDVIVHADNILRLPTALKEVEPEEFYGSSIQEVILPEGMTTIESKAFANCDRLSLIYIPSGVVSIASDAFMNSPKVVIISDGICAATQYAEDKGIPYVIGTMPEEVLIVSYDSTLSVGRTMKFYSYVQPVNAPQTVRWSILEGASIASIAVSGDECTLTASGVGHITIAATAINGITGTAGISVIEHATEYTVWFDTNGGTCDTSSLNARFGEALGTLPVPVRDYHTFDGWYTSANGGNKVTASTVFDDYDMGDITLYAHWTENNWSDWVEASALPGGDILTESKKQYRYQDASYSGWSGWSGWDENRQSTSELKEEESATVWFWYRYVCPNCGKAMHVYDKCYTWADGCGRSIGSSNLQCCWLPVSSSSGTQDWLGTGRIMYGSNSYDRWFYWKDSSQGYPNGKSTTGYRYRTRTKSWGSWSGWTNTAVSASTTRNVETRTVYRYKVK